MQMLINRTFHPLLVRNFTWIKLFTFDSIRLSARLFYRIVVSFSMDGVNYSNALDAITGRTQMLKADNYRKPKSLASDRVQFAADDDSPKHRWSPTRISNDYTMFSQPEWDGAVVVKIGLRNNVGKYVRLSFTTSDTWILLSEVQFNSSKIPTGSYIKIYWFVKPPMVADHSGVIGIDKWLTTWFKVFMCRQ